MLDRANRAVAAFDRALEAFPVPGLAGKLFARLDAVHSSGAEGCTTTFTDLMTRQAKDSADARTVSAAAEAFDDMASSRATPTQLVLDIHRRLFERAADPFSRAQAGRWKTHPNGTYDPDGVDGLFYYTLPASLPDVLADWEALTMGEDDRPELIRQALSHWMFEQIHPVHDGNGRVGRLLVPTLLLRKGAFQHACAFLGEAVHRNKDVYIDGLKDARRSGDFSAWCRVFCAMVLRTALANSARLDQLGAVFQHWRAVTGRIRAHSVVHDLVPWMLANPGFTIREALAAIGGKVSYQAMNAAIQRLQDLGIVTVAGTDRRNRRFVAGAVLDLFDAPNP